MATLNIAKTIDDADAAWASMTADERADVEATLAGGGDPVHAVNLVRSRRRQDAARGMDIDGSGLDTKNPLEEITPRERAESVAAGTEAAIGPSAVMNAAMGPLGPVVGANVALARKLLGTDQAEEDAATGDPAGFAVGRDVVGNIPNVVGAPSMAKGAAAAVSAGLGRLRLGAARATPGSLSKIAEAVPGGGGVAKLLRAAPGDAGPSGDYRAMLREQLLEGPLPDAALPTPTTLDDLAAGKPLSPREPTPTPFPVKESTSAKTARIDAKAAELKADLAAARKKNPLVGTRESRAAPVEKPAPPKGVGTVKERTPSAASKALDELGGDPGNVPPPAGARAPRKSAPREKAIDALKETTPEMPADVMSGGKPAPLAPKGTIASGGADVLAAEVMALPASSRVAKIHALAKLYGNEKAMKIAKLANVLGGMKLNPL